MCNGPTIYLTVYNYLQRQTGRANVCPSHSATLHKYNRPDAFPLDCTFYADRQTEATFVDGDYTAFPPAWMACHRTFVPVKRAAKPDRQHFFPPVSAVPNVHSNGPRFVAFVQLPDR